MKILARVILFVFVLCTASARPLYAQDSIDSTSIEQYISDDSGNADSTISYVEDTTEYEEEGTDTLVSRYIADEDWNEIVDKPDFSYRNTIEAAEIPAKPSKFQLWLQKLLSNVAMFFMSFLGKILFWLLLLSALAYIIFKILKGDVSFFLNRKDVAKSTVDSHVLTTEDLANADWDQKMKEALAQGDLRLSTRFAFVQILQLLNKEQKIDYSIDKTNFEYYLALKEDAELQKLYRQLMLRYEFAWYGHYEVKQEDWLLTMNIFESIKLKLK